LTMQQGSLRVHPAASVGVPLCASLSCS
jgi:hypothetical protein